jgi:aminopeptidase N
MFYKSAFQHVARALLVFGFGSLALAQTAGSSSLNDPIFAFMGNGGYDAQDYDINLRIFGTHQSVDGATTMQAVATQDLSSFNLDFGSMVVTSVIVNGRMARFSQADPELTITPRKPILKGDAMKVSVTYSGKPDSVAVGTSQFGGANFWMALPTQLTVLSEPSAMFAWSPVNDHPSDKATFSLHITAPKAEQAISNGVLTSRIENSDGTATSNYRIATPTATYFVVIAVGDYKLEEQGQVGNVRVRHYLSPKTSGIMRQAVLETPNIIKFFQDKIGAYPFSEVGVLTVNNNLGFALETQSLVTLAASYGRGETVVHDSEIVAHELAHQWFGALVSFKTHKDIFVHEGFAQYFGWLYTDFRYADQGESLKGQIEDVYGDISAGSFVADLTKDQFLERLRSNRYGSTVLMETTLERALVLMFEGTLPQKYHDEIIAKFPSGATVKQMADVIATWNFARVRLGTPARVELIPLTGKPALDVPASYGLLTAPGNLKIGDDLFNQGVYWRGAMTLHALRLKIGDEKFFALLRAYLEKYKFANASVEDFVNLTLEMDGLEAKTLLERWLFDAQCPDLPELGLFSKDFKLGATFSE